MSIFLNNEVKNIINSNRFSWPQALNNNNNLLLLLIVIMTIIIREVLLLNHYSLKTYGDVLVNVKSLTVSALDEAE
jgi:hypothetical protein